MHFMETSKHMKMLTVHGLPRYEKAMKAFHEIHMKNTIFHIICISWVFLYFIEGFHGFFIACSP